MANASVAKSFSSLTYSRLQVSEGNGPSQDHATRCCQTWASSSCELETKPLFLFWFCLLLFCLQSWLALHSEICLALPLSSGILGLNYHARLSKSFYSNPDCLLLLYMAKQIKYSQVAQHLLCTYKCRFTWQRTACKCD